jgi:wobble nucleotide-excising tRNase
MTVTQPSISKKEIIKTIAIPSDCNKYPVFSHYAGKKIPSCENKFQRINLIYGWNYSGKTSLSRIFRDTQKAIVFNRDFVKDNLAFWGQGKNKHFWIIGEEGAKLQRKEQRFIQFQEKKSQQHTQINREIDTWKTDLAKKVKDGLSLSQSGFTKRQVENILGKQISDTNTWLGQNFSIDELFDDLNQFKSEKDFSEAKNILKKQDSPKTIDTPLDFYSQTTDVIAQANRLAGKTVKKGDLLDRLSTEEIKNWARQGLTIHQAHNTQNKCLFCDSTIDWLNLEKQLEVQFNEEYQNLVQEIDTFRENLNTIISRLQNQRNTLNEKEEQKLIRDESKTQWKSAIRDINFDELFTNLNSIKNQLDKKTPDNTFDLQETIFPENFETREQALVDLINSHNELANNYANEKKKAQNTIVKYLFANALPQYKELQKTLSNIAECLQKVQDKIVVIQEQIKKHNESAKRINEQLSKMVVNKQFEIKDEGDRNGFKIYNGSSEMDDKKLSEGEQTIIAFAYFLAKLEEDSSSEREGSNQNYLKIIFIDDPMSSLDSSHLHMLAAQIRELVKNKNYQIFLTTHHYEFFCILREKLQVIQNNEHKKIEKENKKIEEENINADKDNQKDKLQQIDLISFYMLEKYSQSKTNLRKMPGYLEKDRTEYLYCLEQIQKYINGSASPEDEESEFILYSLPNAIRKCLEIFIKFKDPKQKDLSLLDQYLDKHNKKHLKEFLSNIYNDGSHALIIGGRNFSNIKEPSQIKEVARVVYDLIQKDKVHFENACGLIQENN